MTTIHVLTKDGVPIGASVQSATDAVDIATYRSAFSRDEWEGIIIAQGTDKPLPAPFALTTIDMQRTRAMEASAADHGLTWCHACDAFVRGEHACFEGGA